MIIVTGGAGFIGSNIVKGLNNKGYNDIIVVDTLKNSAKHLNLNSLKFSDFIDSEDFLSQLSAISNVTAIFHQGACSDTMETDGEYMMRNNYEYSKKLFNYCGEKNVKFFYASSASVYGNGEKGFAVNNENEYPLNVYAYSKYLFDNYVRLNIKNVKTQVVGLRYFNVYGPQENHKGKMASVFFHFYNQARQNGVIKVFEGSKDFLRDFVFIDDITDINIHFMENQISGIFNCGTGVSRSFYDVALAVKNQFVDKDIKIEEVSFPDALKGKYQAFTQADISGLKKEGLYTKEFTSVEDGMKKYFTLLEKSNGYYK